MLKPKAFKAVQKKVQKDTESICMNLKFIDSEANRKLAVGYGYLTKADLNYAVSHLENNNNEFCSYSDIFELIRGQLSGVTVSENEIYVRGGRNSFSPGATMALYVVDSQPVSGLEWLQPCQIKSISVLKDFNAFPSQKDFTIAPAKFIIIIFVGLLRPFQGKICISQYLVGNSNIQTGSACCFLFLVF